MKPKSQPVTRLDYCQYLLISQINYTLTYFADHTEEFSHDTVNRYLAGDQIRPRLVWENVKYQVVQTPEGYVIFDDTVADKNHSFKIELVRRQYSGNAHGLIKVIKIKGFPKDHKVKLFRVVLSTQRTDYVVTNDLAQNDTQATQQACGVRWKIEQFHRETKQLTGLEGCQCRKARIVRNHIGCAILAWVRLKQVAQETEQ